MEVATLGLKVDGSPVDKASSSLDRFSRSADKAERSSGGLQNSSRTTNKSLADAARSSDRAATSLSGLANAARIAGAAMAAIGVGAFASSTFQAVRSAQQLQASLKTVTGSVQEATVAWGNLLAFAEETPFTLEQSVQGFIRMKSLGLDPTNEALRSFGNTASAMGKDMMQMVEAVADATTGEFERLKEFGIRASKEGDQVSFTFQGVTTTVRNSSEAISRYLQDIGENQFAGAMADQMDTLGGKVSNLEDSIYQFYLAIGEEGATDAFSSALSAASSSVEYLTENVGFLSDAVGYLAVVSAARLTPAIAASAAGMAQKTLATIADAKAEAVAAQAITRRTAAELQSAKALLSTAQLEARATAGTNAHGFALQQLSVARVRAAEAAGAHAAATNTATAAMGRASVAARGLSGALALVGGPVGAALIAAGSLYVFREELGLTQRQSGLTEDELEKLRGEVDDLSEAALNNKINNLTQDLKEATLQAAAARDELRELNNEASGYGVTGFSSGHIGDTVRATSALSDALERQKRIEQELSQTTLELGSRSFKPLSEWLFEVDDAAAAASGGIDGLSDSQRDAQREADRFESSVQSLIDTLFPLQAGLRQYKEDQILLNQAYIQGLISLDQYTEGLKRLREEQMLSQERPDQAYDILSGPTGMGQGEDEDQGGWDKWLESAQTAFTDFDSMAASTAENFQRGFGDAFESMIFDSQNFGDAMYNLFDGIARSLVSALGEMAAQWLAYQAVTAIIGNQGTEQAEQQAIQSGSQIASAYAPAAAMASLASFGQNAFPAIAGIAATNIAAQGFAGLFDNGGNIPAGQWGIAGERGPEIIQGPANITSRRDTADIMNGAQGGMPVDVRVTNNGEPKHAEARSRTEEGRLIIDIMLEDLAGDGRYARALQSGTNVQRRGR